MKEIVFRFKDEASYDAFRAWYHDGGGEYEMYETFRDQGLDIDIERLRPLNKRDPEMYVFEDLTTDGNGS
jgi:hypothetical protein